MLLSVAKMLAVARGGVVCCFVRGEDALQWSVCGVVCAFLWHVEMACEHHGGCMDQEEVTSSPRRIPHAKACG